MLLAAAPAVGFGCGALGEAVNGLDGWGLPYLDPYVGLYAVPPVLLAWAAPRRPTAVAAGVLTALFGVLGHLVVEQPEPGSSGLLAYRAWFPLGFGFGALLGMLGYGVRRGGPGVRAWSAAFPLGMLLLSSWAGVRAMLGPQGPVHPAGLILEGAAALALLAACRGWRARLGAMAGASALFVPMMFLAGAVFLVAARAAGDLL